MPGTLFTFYSLRLVRKPISNLRSGEFDLTLNWQRSREMLERSSRSLAGGVSSPFRARAPVPLFFENGQGSHLWDVDGNEYIDYQLAWGPMILGYNHPVMVDRLRRQVEKPLSYGAQHELEIAVAERIQSLVPCAERLAFTSSGSEAVQLVHRLARAHTGRPCILKFEGHYHGWMDGALHSYKPQPHETGSLASPAVVPGSKGQVQNASENVVVAPWNSLEALENILQCTRLKDRGHHDRACPVQQRLPHACARLPGGSEATGRRGRSPPCFRRSDYGIPHRRGRCPKVTSTSSQTWRPSARLLEVVSP